MSQQRFLHSMLSLRSAMQFLTCIPVGSIESVPTQVRKNMSLWFPMVGTGIGLILASASWATSALHDLLQASLIVTLWVVITGALHLDGLADTADGWVGGLGNRERTLQIMHDPRSGAMAVTAVALTLILKVSALTAALDWTIIVVAPVAARLLIIPAFLFLPYARENGIGADLKQALSSRKRVQVMAIIAIWALLPLLLIPVSLWLMLAVVAGIVFFVWRWFMMRRLGGFTGDCIGLLIESVELALLIAFAVYETGF